MMPKRPLREIMLDVHEEQVKEIYEIPAGCKVEYNDASTQICVDGKPICEYRSPRLTNASFLDRLASIRQERKERILGAHKNHSEYSADQLFHLQFDYELLGLDHLVDTARVGDMCSEIKCGLKRKIAYNTLLTPSTGKTFFEEVHIKELEALGNMLRKGTPISQESFFFEDKGFEHFLKHTATRHKLIRIILDNDSVVSAMQARYDQLPNEHQAYRLPSEVYSQIKELRIEQMRRRATLESVLGEFESEKRQYLKFIGDALDYNEDNRLLRSISFYHIMKDKSIPGRFHELLEERRK